MNIKSLLLGSAAALTAVSGAHAADAVVAAEPEAVEYVRVCDAYGAGYFYIPGTETCLRISGYVRFDVGGGDLKGQTARDFNDRNEAGVRERNDTWDTMTRFTLRTHTASETEMGTLRTYTETRFQWDTDSVGGGDSNAQFESSNTGTTLNFAYIELGGLRLGKDETAFRTFIGYNGNVLTDDPLDGDALFDTNLISYTFTGGNGFSAIVSLEQGGDDYTIDSYLPHVVGGLKYAQGWGAITGVVGYDTNVEEWAGKVRVDVNISDAFEVFVMGGYRSDGDYENRYTNAYASWGGDWIVWAGASYKLNKQTTLNAQVSYDEAEELAAAVSVGYELVPGLKITPEVSYQKYSDDFPSTNGDDAWGGMVRFQRSF